MSGHDLEAAEAYESAVNRLVEALDRLSQSIAHGAGMGLIANGHPSVIQLTRQIQHLTDLSRGIADTIGARGGREVQSLVDRPSVERDDRNTSDDLSANEDDTARV